MTVNKAIKDLRDESQPPIPQREWACKSPWLTRLSIRCYVICEYIVTLEYLA